MKREAPTERDIANLLATAFERMPEPDARRLVAIEQQLLAQPRLRGRKKIVWWWLIGALVAGAASALWWAASHDSGEGREETTVSPSVASPAREQPAHANSENGTDSKSTGNPASKPGTTIYRQER